MGDTAAPILGAPEPATRAKPSHCAITTVAMSSAKSSPTHRSALPQSKDDSACRRFGPARTLNLLVNLTLRVPAQMD
jgi:hypothetical protein